jgi:hypothetical protein
MFQSIQSPSSAPTSSDASLLSPVYEAVSLVSETPPSARYETTEVYQHSASLHMFEPTVAYQSTLPSPIYGNVTDDAFCEINTSSYAPTSPLYVPYDEHPTKKTPLDTVADELIEHLHCLTHRIETDDPTLTTIEPVTAVSNFYGWNLLEQDDGQDAFLSLLRAIRKKGKMMRNGHRTKCCIIRKVVLRCFAAPDIRNMLDSIAAIPTLEELVITDDLEESTCGSCYNDTSNSGCTSRKRRRSSMGSSTSNGGHYINIDHLTDLLKAIHIKYEVNEDDSDDESHDDANPHDNNEKTLTNNNYFGDPNIDDDNNSLIYSRLPLPEQKSREKRIGQKQQRNENKEQILTESTEEAKRQAVQVTPVVSYGWKVIDIQIRIHVWNNLQLHRFSVEGLGSNMTSLTYVSLHFLPRCSIATPTFDFDSIITALSSTISKRRLHHMEIKLGYNHNPYCRPMVSISSLSQLMLSTTSSNSSLRSIILHNFGISSCHVHMIAELLQLKHQQQKRIQVKECRALSTIGWNDDEDKKIVATNSTDTTNSHCENISTLRKLHIVGSLTSSFTDSSFWAVYKSLQAIVQKNLQSMDAVEEESIASKTKTANPINDLVFLFDQLEHVRFGTIEQIQNIRRSLAFSVADGNIAPRKKRRTMIGDSNRTNTTERQFYLYHHQIQHSMRLIRILKHVVHKKKRQLDQSQMNTSNLLFDAICLINNRLLSNDDSIALGKVDRNNNNTCSAINIGNDDNDDEDIGGEFLHSLLYDLVRYNPATLIS